MPISQEEVLIDESGQEWLVVIPRTSLGYTKLRKDSLAVKIISERSPAYNFDFSQFIFEPDWRDNRDPEEVGNEFLTRFQDPDGYSKKPVTFGEGNKIGDAGLGFAYKESDVETDVHLNYPEQGWKT